MLTVRLNGIEYPLATNLMVAYKLQGCNNHKPYLEIFKSIPEATLEKQLELLYTAFAVANPTASGEGLSQQVFENLLLNDPEFNVKALMALIRQVIQGIVGTSDEDEEGNE